MKSWFLFSILFFVAIAHGEIKISPEVLEQKISQKITAVKELKFIREEAKRMGLRVWLFGGTAAGYAHYAKWAALLEAGDKSFQANRFDYDFTNIYRSTQDLDIVADGTIEQIDQFAAILASKYPSFLGSKMKWEVRALRFARGTPGEIGYKEALLNDFDFLNQNTDSNSTGMIEITESAEPTVRDLRDWDSKRCIFFNDVLNSEIHFYRSKNHFKTARAKAGNNPEIFGVVRLLTKAFQYDLKISGENLSELQDIADKFNPNDPMDSVTRGRLIDIGKKLIKHAVNIEYAWNTLEKLGLRKKLMTFDDPKQIQSLAWWLNREPLRSFPVGRGKGKTAAEIGLTVVAHETDSYLSHESITRAHTGQPNFLQSRPGYEKQGETAVSGAGVYARRGRLGARDTGLTIRMNVNPKARLGSDFEIGNEDYIVIKNKNAFEVIPEKLNLTPLEFLTLVSKEESFKGDLALIEKVKRQWQNSGASSSQEDSIEIRKLVETAAMKMDYKTQATVVLFEFFSLPISEQSEDLLEIYLRSRRQHSVGFLKQPHWTKNPKWEKWIKFIFDDRYGVDHVLEAIDSDAAIHHPAIGKIIDRAFQRNLYDTSKRNMVSLLKKYPSLAENPQFGKWVTRLSYTGGMDQSDTRFFINHPQIINSKHWKNIFYGFEKYGDPESKDAAYESLETIAASKNPDWVAVAKASLKSNNSLGEFIAKHPELPQWEKLYTEAIKQEAGEIISLDIFKLPNWPSLVKLLATESSNFTSIWVLLLKPAELTHPKWNTWVRAIIDRNAAESPHGFLNAVEQLMIEGRPEWLEYLKMFLTAIHRGGEYNYLYLDKTTNQFLSHPWVKSNPELLQMINGKPMTLRNLILALEKGAKFSETTATKSAPTCEGLFMRPRIFKDLRS